MRTCFIIMPFRDEYEKLFALISTVAHDYKIDLIRADLDFLSCPVMEEINRCISTCDYIITIIGDDNNANVFYELGISHTKKPFSKVLIFKDVREKYAFDIQHIKQFSFLPEALKDSEKTIRRFFENNVNEDSLENALNSIDYFQNNKSMCVKLTDYLKRVFGDLCNSISKIILSIDNSNIKPVSSTLKDCVLSETETNKDRLLGESLIKLYAEIIVRSAQKYDYSNDIDFLLQNKAVFDNYKYTFTTTLINYNVYLKIAVKWLISYFGKNDVHRIDITRHKIEEFLVLSKSDEVNDALKEALSNEIPHVREYCAEVIREKKLQSARFSLLKQLSIEENLYSARSIIDAIVAIDGIEPLHYEENLQCVKQYASKIKYDEESFIKKHIDIAVAIFSNKSGAKH